MYNDEEVSEDMSNLLKTPTVLIIDDDPDILILLEIFFSADGYRVITSSTGSEAISIYKKNNIDLVITDFLMPTIDGLDILAAVRSSNKPVPVILITGHGSIEKAVDTMKAGAFDYLTKPINKEKLLITARKAIENRRLILENQQLKEQLTQQYGFDRIITQDSRMQKVIQTLKSVAETDVTVLLLGESGTGKELFARSLHYHSRRKFDPFVPVNCAAIPTPLLESEFFGHEKGAFTGAVTRREGRFESANGGTLFLDEIGEMGLDLQAKLLRVMEKQVFERVGGNESIKSDVRLVAATNRNLIQAVKDKYFREDLYYRLNVVTITIPPLRERKSDIPLLANYFLTKYATKYNRPKFEIADETLLLLENYSWPGNVREMENYFERWVVTLNHPQLIPDHLPIEIKNTPVKSRVIDTDTLLDEPMPDKVTELEIAIISAALSKTRGIQSKAAKMLGITERILGYKIQNYKIDIESFRQPTK